MQVMDSFQKEICHSENYLRTERWLKSHRGRQGIIRQLLRMRSALKISRWWRGARTRKNYLKYKIVVTKIQARFRQQLAKRRYRRLRKGAVDIQKWFRRTREKKTIVENDSKGKAPVQQSEKCEIQEPHEPVISFVTTVNESGVFLKRANINRFDNRAWNLQEVTKKEYVENDVLEVKESILNLSAIVTSAGNAEVCVSDKLQPHANYSMQAKCFDEENEIGGLQAHEKIFSVCRQAEVLSFEAVLPCSDPERWKKLGEGNYGEVFGWRDDYGVLSRVFKLIPVEGRDPESDFPQDTIKEVLPELIATRKLSELSKPGSPNFTAGFVKVNGLRYVRGKYPQVFTECHKSRRRKKEKTPALKKYGTYDKSQRYIVIDTEYVGRPLALIKFFTPLQASSIFQQVACSLAAAEEIYHFEHRDLHPGNVLISYTDEDMLEFKVCGETIHVSSQELRATIIDYSLSRLECDDVIYFRDLRDHEFSGYDKTYRMMREQNGNTWNDFYPRTNVFWLQKLWYHMYGKMVHVWCDKNNEYTSKFQFCCVGAEIMDFHSATAIAVHYLPFLANLHSFTGERLHITKYKIPRQSLPSSDQQDNEDDELYEQGATVL